MERAIRYSKKRADILAAIQGTDCHPSAEWVYQQLKPTHPGLSLGRCTETSSSSANRA